MKLTLVRSGLMAALIVSLAGCGKSSEAPAPGTSGNATENNPRAAFSTILDAGLTPVTVNGRPEVKFAVLDSSGKHVPGLTLFNAGGASADPACGGANVKFAIAQLKAYDAQSPTYDTWRSLISNKKTVAASVSPSLFVIYGALDPVPTATIANPPTIDATHPQIVGILTENAAGGYYTYKAATDVTDPAYISPTANADGSTVLTNGFAVIKDGVTAHRAALELCYVDPVSRATVKVNPYIDFTVASDGTVSPIKDSQGKLTEAKKVVDRAACNSCHQNFAMHGGAVNEPQVCVMCHNPGSQDSHNNGPLIDLKLMVHKFHKGKLLTKDYVVNTSVARKTDPVTGAITGVTFPGQLRVCTKCHDGSPNATVRTAQGDNWMLKPAKNACWACHDDFDVPGSKWQLAHVNIAQVFPTFNFANPSANPDSMCANCHANTPATSTFNTSALHAIPEWVSGENYQYNIWSTKLNADRTVTVEYSVSNPKDGTDYDLLDFSPYTYVIANAAGTQKTNTFVFGGGTIYIGWGTDDYSNSGAIGRPWSSDCTTVVASGVPSCDANGLPKAAVPGTPNVNGAGGTLIARGQPVALNILFDSTVRRVGGSNHFTITSTPIPVSATGSGVAAFAGLVNLPMNATTSFAVPVKNVVSYFSLDGGTVVPRRDVVATAKCEACHNKFLKNHGHGGAANATEVCVICHNGNNPLNGTVVSGGAVTQYAESAHLKRAVHIWHKQQATDNKDPVTLLGQGNNFPAQLPITGEFGIRNLRNCNICHVNNSYQRDRSVMGTSRTYDVDLSVDSTNAAVTDTKPSDNAVTSPKAAVCSACHDKDIKTQTRDVRQHMMTVGGATFGGTPASGVLAGGNVAGDQTVTQDELAAKVNELCTGCHAPGAFVGVDVVHSLK